MQVQESSAAVYEQLLRGEATADEYVRALTREVRESGASLSATVERSRRDRAVRERDRHVRAFNSLEKAVTKHTNECPDCEDLARAHRTVMRLLAEGTL